MSTEVRRIVATALGQVHVRLQGGHPTQGGPPLVLLHMSPRSSQMWTYLQPLLGRPSIAPDRPGYGFSDAPPATPAFPAYAAAMWQALDALGVTGQVDLLGMHTGSLEAVEMTLQAPGRVRHLGMVAIPIFNSQEMAAGLQTFAPMRVAPVEDGSHLLPAWKARFQYREPPFDLADVQRRYLDYLLAPWPGQAYDAAFRYDTEAAFKRLKHSVIALAPRDDLIEFTERSRGLLPPGSTYVDLPHCNVDLCRTHPEEIAATVALHMPRS
jgi:pimeloyl-ACP methyl ester carboxylesterase